MMRIPPRHISITANLAIIALVAVSGVPATATEPDFDQYPLQLPIAVESLVISDVNNDGLHDLLAVIDHTMRIYFQDGNGFDFENGFTEFLFPGTAVGWDISDNYGDSGEPAVIALIDGNEVLAWHVLNQSVQAPQVIKSGLSGYLGRGVNRLHFSRDINNDGNPDLIIPGAGELQLYLQTAPGEFASGLPIKSDVRLRSNLDSALLERRNGQEITIPALQMRDVNGDGHADIISRTDQRLDVFLASQNGNAYFSTTPSYSVDITGIEAGLGEFDIDNLDFSNLTGILALTHEEILEDIDGDGIEDLLLREGGKVSLFGGTATSMDLTQPRQVLRSGGNVLSTFVHDENGDGLKDLWLWRVESISVGDVFVWLALSGSISIEAFIYPNEGNRFARRPTRQITVDLKFPSVIRLAASARELREEVDHAQTSLASPAIVANLDSDQTREDLLVLMNQQVQVFLNSIAHEAESPQFLGSLGYSRERDNYEIDIRQIIDSVALNTSPLLEQVQGQTPSLIIDIPTATASGDIISARLNGDAIDDLFVFTTVDDSHIKGLVLLSKDSQ